MTIHDVLSYGPIVAHDEESGCLVTANGSYLNLFVPHGDGWECTECTTWGDGTLYDTTAATVMDCAEEALANWLRADEEDSL